MRDAQASLRALHAVAHRQQLVLRPVVGALDELSSLVAVQLPTFTTWLLVMWREVLGMHSRCESTRNSHFNVAMGVLQLRCSSSLLLV